MKVLAVIPARYGSTRLPHKVLLHQTGKYLVQHTYEQVRKARLVDQSLIATDDLRIIEATDSFGAIAVLTSRRHRSGTDRIAAVAKTLNYEIIVNIQADEPEIAPSAIDKAVTLAKQYGVDIATLATPIKNAAELSDPSKAKVVLDKDGFALYFSRAPIPFDRDAPRRTHGALRHIGIYAYKRDALLRFSQLKPTHLEQTEQLEQLRALENGFRIKVGIVKTASFGIDTPEDYKKFVKRVHSRKR